MQLKLKRLKRERGGGQYHVCRPTEASAIENNAVHVNGFASSLHLQELFLSSSFFFFLDGFSMNVSRKCFYYDVKGSVKKVGKKERPKKKDRRPPDTPAHVPVFSSAGDVPARSSVSLLSPWTSTKIHSFKSFWNSFFLLFFVHKNYKKLQKAPLNRPAVTVAVGSLLTTSRSPPQNSSLIYLFSGSVRDT